MNGTSKQAPNIMILQLDIFWLPWSAMGWGDAAKQEEMEGGRWGVQSEVLLRIEWKYLIYWLARYYDLFDTVARARLHLYTGQPDWLATLLVHWRRPRTPSPYPTVSCFGLQLLTKHFDTGEYWQQSTPFTKQYICCSYQTTMHLVNFVVHLLCWECILLVCFVLSCNAALTPVDLRRTFGALVFVGRVNRCTF